MRWCVLFWCCPDPGFGRPVSPRLVDELGEWLVGAHGGGGRGWWARRVGVAWIDESPL